MLDGASSCAASLAFFEISWVAMSVLRMEFFDVRVQLIPKLNLGLVVVRPRQREESSGPVRQIRPGDHRVHDLPDLDVLRPRERIPHPLQFEVAQKYPGPSRSLAPGGEGQFP